MAVLYPIHGSMATLRRIDECRIAGRLRALRPLDGRRIFRHDNGSVSAGAAGMHEANPAEYERFGVEPGWSFAIRHRVRWSECDPFRHANHRAYFEWFEEARNRYLEAVGLPPLSAGTPGPVMAETGIRYVRPLAYGDEVLVSARTVRLGHTSFEMEYAVWRQGLCAQGRAVLILVVNATGEKVPLPPDMRRAIAERDPNAGEAGRRKGHLDQARY
jgi:acyl-CoA thioester hydrolase